MEPSSIGNLQADYSFNQKNGRENVKDLLNFNHIKSHDLKESLENIVSTIYSEKADSNLGYSHKKELNRSVMKQLTNKSRLISTEHREDVELMPYVKDSILSKNSLSLPALKGVRRVHQDGLVMLDNNY